MALGNVFKNVAELTVSVFAKEQGNCTYKQRISASSYDPLTGVSAPKYNEHKMLITFTDLEDKEVLDLPNRAEHRKALVPGKGLSFTPQKGDIVQNQDGVEFLVSRVKSDMYGALFSVYIKEINES